MRKFGPKTQKCLKKDKVLLLDLFEYAELEEESED